MKENKGSIFNIQKCSIHDGHGMRTTVFFKGCGLHCIWCANPESIAFEKQVAFNANNCIGCGACVRICKQGAIEDKDGQLLYDKTKCDQCGDCASVCPTEARRMFGKEYTADEVVKIVKRDSHFFRQSGGGVTLSGGEILMQPEFFAELSRRFGNAGINVAIETCGFADYAKFAEGLDHVDYIFYDLKHMDTEQHKRITGAGNELILENLKKIDKHGIEICIRTPVVPGWNDDAGNIAATAEFIKELSSVRRYELLAYHKLGLSKYEHLGIDYPLKDVNEPSEEQMMRLVDIANEILSPVGKKCFYNKDNNADE